MSANVSTTLAALSASDLSELKSAYFQPLRFQPLHLLLKSVRAMVVYGKYRRPVPCDQPVLFLLSAERTGSQFVCSMLESTRLVGVSGEVLNIDNLEGPARYACVGDPLKRHLNHVVKALRAMPCVKIVLYQMEGFSLTPTILKSWFPCAKFLVLYRRNLAQQYLSVRFAVLTDQWDCYKQNVSARGKLRIDRSHLMNYIDLTIEEYRRLLTDTSLNATSCTVTDYETMASCPQRVFDGQVFPFIGLPRCPVLPGTVKVLPWSPSELVSNYDEVCDIFSGPLGQMPLEITQWGKSGAV